MSVQLNNFSISAGLNFFAKQAVHAADRLTELTFHVLDGTTTSLGRLVPDFRPKSVGDVVLQTKNTGSALFDTPEGDVLIEITQNEQGRYTFLATGEDLEPVIFAEGKKKTSRAVWEVMVSTYLQKIVGSSSRVDYGVSASRWTGEKFADLKEKYSAEGLLRKKGDEVILKLPDEPLMTFKGPQANLKAKIVLKHFYQSRKTPMEEEQSKHWDFLNRLFIGYLYFSGYALAPWVNDHVLLPHQRTQIAEEKAQRMTADGYLDEHELREMAQNPILRQHVTDMAEAQADGGDATLLSQLENVTFQPNGYTQTYEYDGKSYKDSHAFSTEKETHSRKICPKEGYCEEFITEKSKTTLTYTQKKYGEDKIDVQTASFKKDGDEWKLVRKEEYEEARVFKLADRSFASTIFEQSRQIAVKTATACVAAALTGHNPKIAVLASLFTVVSRSRGIAVLPPVSETHQVKEIKSGPGNSMMRKTAPITLLNPLPNLSVEPGSALNYLINLPSYCQLSSPNANLELSIQQASGAPAPSWISMNMGDITFDSSLYLGPHTSYNVYVSGKYAYVGTSGGIIVVDISNPTSPSAVGSFPLTGGPQLVFVSGNYAYITSVGQSFSYVVDVSNPSNLTLVDTVNAGSHTFQQMSGAGNYLYFAEEDITYRSSLNISSLSNPVSPAQIGSLGGLVFNSPILTVVGDYVFLSVLQDVTVLPACAMVNVSVPSKPVLITTIPLTGDFSSASMKGNYLFITAQGVLNIYNLTTVSNPVLVQSIYVHSIGAMHLDGNYLYISGYPGVTVIDITNPLMPKIVKSISTPGGISNELFVSGNNIFVADNLAGLTIFNAQQRVLSGTPQASDRGLLLLNVTATNDVGDTLVDSIAVHVGDINVAIPIPNQQVYVGNSITLTLPEGTFEFPNANFTYSAGLAGGFPLPSCITFDSATRTFQCTPRSGDQNTYVIQVAGDDGHGGIVSTTFGLTVIDGTKYAPVVLNPLPDAPATVGVPFFMQIPADTFKDLNGEQLTITVNQGGGMPLPQWLKWNPKLLTLSGTPGPFDTNTYADRIVTINVWGKDNDGSAKTSFTISVGGESFWAAFIKIGFGTASAVGTAYGLWKERALIWNYLCKKKYRGEPEKAIVNQHYSHVIKLERKKVKEITVFSGGKPLPQLKPLPDGLSYKFGELSGTPTDSGDKPLPQLKPLPDGLSYEFGELSGTPTGKDLGRFIVRVFDHDGYIYEEFDLIIKKSESDSDPDPEDQFSCIEAIRKMIFHPFVSGSPRRDGDEEGGKGCLGRVKKHLPTEFPMRNLRKHESDNT